MKQFTLIALILTVIIGANMREGIIGRIGFEPNILLATLIALVIAGLVVHRRILFVVIVIGLVIAANMPTSYALAIGYDPDYMLAALIALVLTPLVASRF